MLLEEQRLEDWKARDKKVWDRDMKTSIWKNPSW